MFLEEISLYHYSYYKIGGPARYFYQARDINKLAKAVEKAKQLKLPIFILGGGTNILISDEGFTGLVLKPEFRNIAMLKYQDTDIRVGAGVLMSDLVNFCIEKGLSGIEWAGGLPGTVGGAIRGNAGAFGGEMKDCIKEVISLDISKKAPKIIKRTASQCAFSYRLSIFKQKKNDEIINEVVFKLKQGDKKAIQEAVEHKIFYRHQYHPMDYPSLGSTFKNVSISRIAADLNADIAQIDVNSIRVNPRCNPHKSAFVAPVKNDPFPIIPAAYLIEQAGLKGVSCGGAMISPKHANFVVNVLNATAGDVKNLIQLVKFTIKKKFGINLEEEIEYC